MRYCNYTFYINMDWRNFSCNFILLLTVYHKSLYTFLHLNCDLLKTFCACFFPYNAWHLKIHIIYIYKCCMIGTFFFKGVIAPFHLHDFKYTQCTFVQYISWKRFYKQLVLNSKWELLNAQNSAYLSITLWRFTHYYSGLIGRFLKENFIKMFVYKIILHLWGEGGHISFCIFIVNSLEV